MAVKYAIRSVGEPEKTSKSRGTYLRTHFKNSRGKHLKNVIFESTSVLCALQSSSRCSRSRLEGCQIEEMED